MIASEIQPANESCIVSDHRRKLDVGSTNLDGQRTPTNIVLEALMAQIAYLDLPTRKIEGSVDF